MATTDNGNRERAIFEAALDIASAEGRLAYLKGACGEDAALLARVQALLRAHEAPEGFLPERPRDGATVTLNQRYTDEFNRPRVNTVKKSLYPSEEARQ